MIHSGSKDNFVINERSGEITLSKDATLDIQRNGDKYDIKVQAVDKGQPFSQTGSATVSIVIEDINDKLPEFPKKSYTEYVLESTPVGQPVLQVLAIDQDRNANVEYSIVEPITARDKTGNTLQNRAAFDYSKAFAIDPVEGTIVVQNPLSHNSVAVVILTIEAKDLNADSAYPNQTATGKLN